MTNGNGSDQGGNSNGNGSTVERRFLDVLHGVPLGRMAEQECASLADALANGKPITPEIMIDCLETLGRVMRRSQYVTPDTELAMEVGAATPFLKRLAAGFTVGESR